MSRSIIILLSISAIASCVEPEPDLDLGTETDELARPPRYDEFPDVPDDDGEPDLGGGLGGFDFNITRDQALEDCYQQYKYDEGDCYRQFANDLSAQAECLDSADYGYASCKEWADRQPVAEESPVT